EAAAKKKPAKKASAGGAKKGIKKASGPAVSELLVQAVSASKERSGVSLAALKKVLSAGGYDVDKNKSRLKIALKALVTKGSLVQVKGHGPPDRSRSTRSSPTATRRATRSHRRRPSPRNLPPSPPRRRRPAKPPPQPRAPRRSRPPRDRQRLQPRR
ncbi:unnamed protein product, partial [Staurois parvus]